MFGTVMDCCKICVFLVFAGLLLLHTTVGATEYSIPEAVFLDQGFTLDGSTISGSVFKYTNNRNCMIYFDFKFETPLSPQAMVTFKSGNDEDRVFNNDTVETFNAANAQFSLTGKWSGTDKVRVRYHAMQNVSGACEKIRDINDRNATNLEVMGDYAIQEAITATQRIWTRDNCRVRVTSGGTSVNPAEKCTTQLNFVSAVAGNQTISADQSGNRVTSDGNHADFNVVTTCSSGFFSIYYQEDCAQEPSSAVVRTPVGLLITWMVLILML
ncbi:unnamed protein product [Calicophoron daubneyi]|uniref:Uncharacterized protein n=1 Tax=Calicophoron daubneyi TaxID=300641 RepID=A0AAV2U1C2_CALDB